MKSIIGELIKFAKDQLKGKKKRKKVKAKQKERNELKKSLASTFLAGNYDMISPPNQITPTAFFEKLKSGFNHSKVSSAFACPRDSSKANITSSVPTNLENRIIPVSGKSVGDVPKSSSIINRQLPPGVRNGINGLVPTFSGDMPVLNDILTYKSSKDSRQKDPVQPVPTQLSSVLQTSPLHRGNSENSIPTQSLLNSFSPARHINGLYHYPFLTEQPMLLSSLRQPDHIFRPSPQYPLTSFAEDPYQPLFISQLSNPYYSPQSAWQHHPTSTSSSAYAQL